MKHEWRKEEKELYIPKEKPVLVNVPKHKFLTIKGEGNPNGPDFAKRIETLYALSYGIKMLPRKGVEIEGYYEYTVYPLEGVWDLSEEGRRKDYLDKNELVYKIMIRQPDFITKDIVDKVMENVKNKKPELFVSDVEFEEIEDGLSVQMLHVGPYDDEYKTFEKMNMFIEENNLVKTTLIHKEIYLSDFRRVEKEKLKTVLRYFVKYKD